MTTITCFGGVGQVGGNQFLLEDGDTRLFFDFGTPFSQRGRFYEEYLNPRPGFGLLDPLTMGLLPPLEGIYRKDMEQATPDLWSDLRDTSSYRDLRSAEISGVLLSHAHLDHTGYLSFLRPEIPILTTSLTAFVAKAIQDTSAADFETEVAYAIPKELTDNGLLKSGDYRKAPATQRRFRVFDGVGLAQDALKFWIETPESRGLEPQPLSVETTISGVEIRCFITDHSIPGACAFAVKTSAGWVAYTGDIRFHGGRQDRAKRFVEELRALKPIALLCEGTRADLERENDTNFTEQDVRERALREIRSATGLVIADFGSRNVERLQIFADVAREAGRALVIMPKDAYLLKAANLIDASIPSILSVSDLYIYDDPKSRTQRWEKAVRAEYASRLVSPDQVRGRQDEFVLAFSFYDVNDFPSIRPRPGSLYLYSSHEAFDEELHFDFDRLRNWIDHFEMRHVGLPLRELRYKARAGEEGLHASGHADAKSLAEVVLDIAPKTLIPIHTEARGIDYFRQRVVGAGMNLVEPIYGQLIRLSDLP